MNNCNITKAMEISLTSFYKKYPRTQHNQIWNKFCRNSSQPSNPQNLTQIKNILQKYIFTKDKSGRESEPCKTMQKIQKLSKITKNMNTNKPSHETGENFFNNKKPNLFNSLRIYCKSPVPKLRKSPIKKYSNQNNVSLSIRKLSYSIKNFNKKSSTKEKIKAKENSNYSSYSNIYRGLLEKIPLN